MCQTLKKLIKPNYFQERGVNSATAKEPVRIVYLLTVNGRAVRQLKRLIKKLFDGRNYFYIHVDARQDYMFNQMKQLADKYPDLVRVSKKRFSTIWGGKIIVHSCTVNVRGTPEHLKSEFCVFGSQTNSD